MLNELPILNILMWGLLGFMSSLVVYMINAKEVRGGSGYLFIWGMVSAIVSGLTTNLLLGLEARGLDPVSLLVSMGVSLTASLIYLILFSEVRRELREEASEEQVLPSSWLDFPEVSIYSKVRKDKKKSKESV